MSSQWASAVRTLLPRGNADGPPQVRSRKAIRHTDIRWDAGSRRIRHVSWWVHEGRSVRGTEEDKEHCTWTRPDICTGRNSTRDATSWQDCLTAAGPWAKSQKAGKRQGRSFSTKGEDLDVARNWRPISLICIVAKLYSSLIAKRLMFWTTTEHKLSPEQKGFTPFGCLEYNFTLQSTIQAVSWLDLTNTFGIQHDAASDIFVIALVLSRLDKPIWVRNV